ncbi:MAG TPA: hypothetical protein VH092_18995 [Urbifossiella sp.]|nr:hypothetical protein [Urbifossiella sp.]
MRAYSMSRLNDPGKGSHTWVAGRKRDHTLGIYPKDFQFLESVFKKRGEILGKGSERGYRQIYGFYSASFLTTAVTKSALANAERAIKTYGQFARKLKVKATLQLSIDHQKNLGLKDWPVLDDFEDYLLAQETRALAGPMFIYGFIHFRKSNDAATHRVYLNVHPEHVPAVLEYLLTRLYHPANGVAGVRNIKCASIGIDRTDTIVIFHDGSGDTRGNIMSHIGKYQGKNGRLNAAHFRLLRPPLTKSVNTLIGVSEALEPQQVSYLDVGSGEFNAEGSQEQQSFGKFNAEVIYTALKTAGDDEAVFVTLVKERLAAVKMPMPRAVGIFIGDNDTSMIQVERIQFVVGGPPKTSFLDGVVDPFG